MITHITLVAAVTMMVALIQGVNVKEELMGLVDELPTVYVKVTEMLGSVRPAISYYKSFVEFSCSRWVWLYRFTF